MNNWALAMVGLCTLVAGCSSSGVAPKFNMYDRELRPEESALLCIPRGGVQPMVDGVEVEGGIDSNDFFSRVVLTPGRHHIAARYRVRYSTGDTLVTEHSVGWQHRELDAQPGHVYVLACEEGDAYWTVRLEDITANAQFIAQYQLTGPGRDIHLGGYHQQWATKNGPFEVWSKAQRLLEKDGIKPERMQAWMSFTPSGVGSVKGAVIRAWQEGPKTVVEVMVWPAQTEDSPGRKYAIDLVSRLKKEITPE